MRRRRSTSVAGILSILLGGIIAGGIIFKYIYTPKTLTVVNKTTIQGTENLASNSPRGLYTSSLKSNLYEKQFPDVNADAVKQKEVRDAFLFAWTNYKDTCWGRDELRPLTQTCEDRLHAGLTIVDSLSTLYVMGLTEEFQKARDFVANDFKPRGSWSTFEFIIRFLGGFISAYELSGDKLFLEKAKECGDAIYSLFDENNGFFKTRLTLRTVDGKVDASGRPGRHLVAEVGTYQLEFLKLSALTGDMKFAEMAMKVYKTIWKNNPNHVLISDPHATNGGNRNAELHIGAAYDSYYEYIIKSYVLTRGSCQKMLDVHVKLMQEIKDDLVFTTSKNKLVGIGIKHGNRVVPVMEHLATFVAGMIAVGTVKGNPAIASDMKLADDLIRTFSHVQQNVKSKLMVEKMSYDLHSDTREYRIMEDEYMLRPETVESIYVMWKFTGLQKYRDIAWQFFQGIMQSAKVEHGFATTRNLDSENVNHKDIMESFFLAETLKYLYLTFSDSKLISPTEWVFNTEAHPLRIMTEEQVNSIKQYLVF